MHRLNDLRINTCKLLIQPTCLPVNVVVQLVSTLVGLFISSVLAMWAYKLIEPLTIFRSKVGQLKCHEFLHCTTQTWYRFPLFQVKLVKVASLLLSIIIIYYYPVTMFTVNFIKNILFITIFFYIFFFKLSGTFGDVPGVDALWLSIIMILKTS